MKTIWLVMGMAFLAMGLFAQSAKCNATGPHGPGKGPDNCPGKYDISHQKVITGKITKTLFDAVAGRRNRGFQMIVSVNDKQVPVFLAPYPYLKRLDITLTTGTFVTMTGVFVAGVDGTDVFLVRILVLDKNTKVFFRDEAGLPLWRAERSETGDVAGP